MTGMKECLVVVATGISALGVFAAIFFAVIEAVGGDRRTALLFLSVAVVLMGACYAFVRHMQP